MASRQDASTGEIISDDSQSKDDSGRLHVKVYSPFQTYYDSLADSVSAVNDTGPFDVLIGHKNFLTLISPCEIIIRNGEKEEKIPIARGIMHVHENTLTVFLDV